MAPPTAAKIEKMLIEKVNKRKAVIAMRNSLEKFIAKFDEEFDLAQVPVRLETLDRLNSEFLELQDAIEKLDDPEGLDGHLDERVDFETRYCVAKGFLLSKRPEPDLNQSVAGAATSRLNTSFSSTFHLRLPKIDLPKFSGDYSRWLSFRDTFISMVHSNGDMPTVVKLQYLLQCLEGDAKKPFECIDIEADNYASTWDALLKRYDNRRLLKRQLFRALYDLPAVKQESAALIHTLVDDFQRHVKALAKLGDPVEHWDTPLVNLLSYKLDNSTLRAWEEDTRKKDEVTYEEFVEFLYQRVRILKAIGPSLSSSSYSSSSSPSFKVAGVPGKSPKTKSVSNTASSSKSSPSCICGCSESHPLRSCPVFLGKDLRQRKELVSNGRLCWNCLTDGHQARKCGSKWTCRTCHDKHHSLLHDPSKSSSLSNTSSKLSATPAVVAASTKKDPLSPAADGESSASGSEVAQVSMAVQTACNTVLLETVVLNVVDDHGKEYEARALLDSASMSNFMSKQLAKQLFVQKSKVDISIAGIGVSSQRVRSAVTATISSRNQSFSTQLEFLILRQPSADLPTVSIDASAWKFPNIKLADTHFSVPGKIDLVIGSEAFWELHTGRKISLGRDLPWVAETPFGWAVSGITSTNATCTRVCQLSTDTDRLEAALQRFWEVEAIPDGPAHSLEEHRCEQFFNATTTRDSTGRYVVRIPRTESTEVTLGKSRAIAERRLLSLESRFVREPTTKAAYVKFMDEYEQLGHMTKLADPVDDQKEHCYLPHHPVFKESSTSTKVRVVFNASSKTSSGHSVNETMLVGPVVQPDLYSTLLKFRFHAIALVADVEKMYRQVRVHPDDCSLQRILWRANPTDPISTYELQTVTYGTASAPYLATRTLSKIAQDGAQQFPLAVGPVTKDFYVDDLISGAPDVESAVQIRREVSALLKSAGFPLKKWASNSPEVLQDIPPEDLALLPVYELQDDQTVTTLGLVWEPKTDTLRFKVQLPVPAAVLTMRKTASYIASIWDPYGIVGPTTLKAKLFMQHLWTLKASDKACAWDAPLPRQLQVAWKEFHNTLHLLGEIRIPRFVCTPGLVDLQLHFFSDASESAYGTCCYVRAESTQGVVSVKLLTSKSKVASLSSHQSIPRLELCGAVLSVTLYKKVQAALKCPFTAFFWTDSTTVLQWLRLIPSQLKTYVANRVSKVQLSTEIDNWNHVPGVDNPADDISRGLSPTELIDCSRWWNGPPWLKLTPEFWPKTVLAADYSVAASGEGRKVPVVALTATQVEHNNKLFGVFSRFWKLQRATANGLRYMRRLRERSMQRRTDPTKYSPLTLRKTNPQSAPASLEPLSLDDLQHAELVLCRLAQKEHFAAEILDLSKGKQVDNSSRLRRLNPFLDSQGTLRVGGRLGNAGLTRDAKHPIVLSAAHPLAALLVSRCHLQLLHAASLLMQATLRQKFWILGSRNLTKSVIHRCHTCFRSKPTLIQQSVADLPAARVTPTPPFAVCGIDYCGPFFVKSPVRNRAPTKVYVAIFVCFATRAVHIELVSDLSTAAFIAALTRMTSRRGPVVELNSDNATAFKGASHELNRIYRMLKAEGEERRAILNWCAEKEIRWKFIPPRAPHFGGLWEAAVKSAKTHLLKTMGAVSATYEDLLTLLAQVEMCLNSRPLTPIPDSPSDLEVLTPGHFLVHTNLQSVPDLDRTSVPDNRLDHWKLTQKRVQLIWSRWYPEYLQQLQTRAKKGCNPPVKIEVGKVVIIKEDNVPTATWPLGLIVKLHPGKDGIVRVVTLRTASGKEITRAVARIALLPESPSPSTPSPSSSTD